MPVAAIAAPELGTVDFFRLGAQAMREMQARFVEQGGDPVTAGSMRVNWNPSWGEDPGPLDRSVKVLPMNADGLVWLTAKRSALDEEIEQLTMVRDGLSDMMDQACADIRAGDDDKVLLVVERGD